MDILRGDAVDNVIWGAAGNDQLAGRRGSDIMDGGAGADTFVFAAVEIAAGEVDRVAAYDVADRYAFQNTLQPAVSYQATATGAAIVVGLAGGAFTLDVAGASVAQLQAQTDYFA
jgi:Ca2+-binding RTX toxin-like protein